jgi:hypothetical protein
MSVWKFVFVSASVSTFMYVSVTVSLSMTGPYRRPVLVTVHNNIHAQTVVIKPTSQIGREKNLMMVLANYATTDTYRLRPLRWAVAHARYMITVTATVLTWFVSLRQLV